MTTLADHLRALRGPQRLAPNVHPSATLDLCKKPSPLLARAVAHVRSRPASLPSALARLLPPPIL